MSAASIGRRLAAGGAWSVTGRLVTVLSGLAVNMFLTRLLTPEEFGVYVLILTIAGIAALIGQCGASQAALRIVAALLSEGRRATARAAVMRSFAVALVGVAAACGVLLTLGGWIGSHVFESRQVSDAVVWIALITLLTAWQAMLSETYRAYQDIRSAAIFGGTLAAVFFLVPISVIFFFHAGAALNDVLGSLTAAYFVALVAGTAFLGTRIRRDKNGETYHTLDLLKVALPLALPNLVTILFQLDTWILGAYRPEAEVAAYASAAKVAFIISAPLMVVNFAVAPFITELHSKKDIEKLEQLLRVSATAATVPAVLLFAGFTIWSKEVLAVLFGQYYAAGGTSLILLGLAQLIVSWTGSCGNVLLMVGKKRLLVGLYAAAGAIMIALCVLLAAGSGAVGVSAGYLAGTAALNVGAWLVVKRSVGIYSHSYMLPSWKVFSALRRGTS